MLVPSFNKASYIEETLQSVYAQTLSNIEIIVVDDGSTDGSPELLEKHRGRCTILLGPNQGASKARQRALERSSGRYVQYLDADDLLEPRALELCVEALERSGADIAYGNWQRHLPAADGRFVRGAIVRGRMQDVDPDPEIACFTQFWAPPAALLYRRTLIARIPLWHDALPVIQDARYLQEAAFAHARFVHVDHVTALYREDPSNSLSQRSRRGFVQDMVRNASEIEAKWCARAALTTAQRRALYQSYSAAARMIFREDDAIFDACCEHLRAIEEHRALRWPAMASRLRATLGKANALRLLALLRRPAL